MRDPLSHFFKVYKEVREELDKKYGEGRWNTRTISRLRKDKETPSLTLTSDLEAIGLKVGDTVIVAIDRDNRKIIIEPLMKDNP